jgi:hypothetical protein
MANTVRQDITSGPRGSGLPQAFGIARAWQMDQVFDGICNRRRAREVDCYDE